MRPYLFLLCAPLLILFLAGDVEAEEIFVLDNGVVLRGRVVREDDKRIVVQLSGFAEQNTVTVRATDLVRRFTSIDPRASRKRPPAAGDASSGGTVLKVPPPASERVPASDEHSPPVPTSPAVEDAPSPDASIFDGLDESGEPDLESESFFLRVRRVSGIALPRTLEGLAVVAVLCFVVLTILVAGGTRALGMKAPSLGASSSLGLLLGVFLLLDFLLHVDLLRADRAIWVLPSQAVVWLVVARTALDAPISRTVPLFAFVLFGSTCFLFFTGSVLVSL
jgi:hypothetical protein